MASAIHWNEPKVGRPWDRLEDYSSITNVRAGRIAGCCIINGPRLFPQRTKTTTSQSDWSARLQLIYRFRSRS